MKKTCFFITVNHEGKEWSETIEKVPFIIGRDKKADVVISSDLISRQHLRVGYNDGKFWIEDLGSSNGTYLESKKIVAQSKVYYREDQILRIGSKLGLQLRFKVEVIEIEDILEFPQTQIEELPEIRVANGSSFVPPLNIRRNTPDEEDYVSKMSSAEKNLFSQIKKMVGSEAENMRLYSLKEANRIKLKAEEEKAKIILEAQQEAELLLKNNQEFILQKTQEFNTRKSEIENQLEALKKEESSRAAKVHELQLEEQGHKLKISQLEDCILENETRIKNELESLDLQKQKLEQDRNNFHNEYEYFKLEERKIRAKLETEIQEAKLMSVQIQTDAKRYQAEIDQLAPELNALKSEKSRLEEATSYLVQERQKNEQIINTLKLEQDSIHKEHARYHSEVKTFQEDIKRLEKEIAQKRQETAAHMAKAKGEAAQILDQAKNQSKEILERSQMDLDELDHQKKALMKSIETEANSLRQIHQEEYEKLLNEKTDLAYELKQIREEANAQYAAIIEKAQEKAKVMMRDAQAASEKERSIAQKEVSQCRLKKEALEVELSEAKTQVETMLEKARKESSDMMKSAKESADQVLTKERLVFDEEIARLRLEAQKNTEELRRKGEELLAKTDAEARENKMKEQQKLAELKQAEIFNIKELKVKAEEDILKRKHEHAKNVSTNVYALLASEMYKQKDKVLDDTLIENFSKGIKDLIVDTMLDRVGPDDDKLQTILKISTDAKNKERNYWKKLKVTAFGSAFALMTLIAFPQILTYPRNKIVAAFTERGSSQSDHFLNQVKEARLKSIYNPPTTVDFKSTYAENVLFTTDYMSKLQNQAFQDKWILDLNEFFIKSLDVKDTTIIKFVSLEAALLKDLIKLKESTDPENPEQKIQEMKDREQEFRRKLADIFEDPEKVSRYYSFADKFWNDFYNPRRAAR